MTENTVNSREIQSSDNREELLSNSKRVVIKLGTAILMQEQEGLALSRFYSFVESISRLHKSGKEILLVSSGAVGMGVQHLGLEKRPKYLPMIQACAAVGQGILLSTYSDAFSKLGIKTAQVLLSEEDFSNRKRYLNLRTAISELLKLRIIPIINENDTVSTSELETLNCNSNRLVNFGDNDKLSALVTSKIDADLLLILTDVDGLFSDDPCTNKDAKLIETVVDISPYLVSEGRTNKKNGAVPDSSKAANSKGRGGIRSKLEAAKIVTQTGSTCIIASGNEQGVIDRIFAKERLGTLFLPQKSMRGRSRWIGFASTAVGTITVNDGAKEALVERNASLLPAGIISVGGPFARGDVVRILDLNGNEFARGLANYSSAETEKISGKNTEIPDDGVRQRNYSAVVKRDNIAITS